MSHVIFDPDDPSRAIIQDATDEWGFPHGPSVILNVHPAARCEGRGCVIHHPSDHHMVTWPLTWRGDWGDMERTCPHGIGHPDPDDAAYRRAAGKELGAHGCDGCCRPPA